MSGFFEQLPGFRQPRRYLFFDTETDGLPMCGKPPHLVQLAWMLTDAEGTPLAAACRIIRPDGFTIPFEVVQVHGITTERALAEGFPLTEVFEEAAPYFAQADVMVAHNVELDMLVLNGEYRRLGLKNPLHRKKRVCTMKGSSGFCALPRSHGGFKWPRLTELHRILFNEPFEGAHDAEADCRATARCFFELRARGVLRG